MRAAKSLNNVPTRSQSSNMRWVCRWPDVISIRRRTKWVKPWVGAFSTAIGPTYGLTRLPRHGVMLLRLRPT
jgi:hypothetical protein